MSTKTYIKTFLFAFIACFLVINTGNAQRKYVKILQKTNESQEIRSEIPEAFTSDSLGLYSKLDSLRKNLTKAGYILASVDSVWCVADTCTAKLYLGTPIFMGKINMTPEQQSIAEAAGLGNVKWKSDVANTETIAYFMESLLVYLENNGFPFARVNLTNSRLSEEKLVANLNIEKGQLIRFDTMSVQGNANISRTFLRRYLDIFPEDVYSKKKILSLRQKLRNLGFIQSKEDPTVSFVNGKAIVNLVLEPQRASRFDFIIGVLPTVENNVRKWNITGEFTGEMRNKLGYGESIFAQFKRLKPETQELQLRVNYPYLLNFPIGVDAEFELFKNANSYLDVHFNAGLSYIFSGTDYFKAYWSQKTSRLLDLDTIGLLSSARLPERLDLNYTSGGLELSTERLDYRFNPSRGWKASLNANAGIKKIIINQGLKTIQSENINFENSYDTLDLNTFQTELLLDAACYFSPVQWATVKMGLRSGFKYNEARLYENEFFRIGGNKILRGFDEESILTDFYNVLDLEFRIILDQNSYLSFPFIDFGLTRIRQDGEEKWDTPIGTGIGINFATPAGIFNVSFAVGRRLSNPIDLNNTKIHFGYVSLF